MLSDEGRTNLDPQVNPNDGTVYWHGWPDGIPIKWQRQKKSGDHL
jgi:hypothetical protein